MKMIRVLYFLFLYYSSVIVGNCLDCEKYIDEPKLQYAIWKDLENCLPMIGKNEINLETAENIWRLIKMEFNDDVNDIPISIYKNMGYILTGINVNDLRNITFNDIELIKVFGSSNGMRDEQLKVVAENIRNDWISKSPQTYSEYDLKILKQILCFMNESEILNIHADAYKEAAEIIGELQNCPIEILQAFAKLAIQPNAFGQPSKWSKIDIGFIGRVVLGLDSKEYQSISEDALSVNRKLFTYQKNFIKN